MKRTILILSILTLTTKLMAQLPDTDIWLVDIDAGSATITAKAPENITNRTGYDNQPAFAPDAGSLLYTSIRDGRQSDIYRYDLNTKTISQLTNTVTSEYSPTFIPDGSGISVVMVEADSTQRLWKFPLEGGIPALIIKNIDHVGYHAWIDNSHVALFLITSPFQLIIADLAGERQTLIVHDTVGRAMSTVNTAAGHKFFYSYHGDIFSLNADKNYEKTRETFKKFKGEDFALINPNTIIMGDGSKIYKNQYTPNERTGVFEWTEIADLAQYGIINITRIAVSPDGKRLAVVAESK